MTPHEHMLITLDLMKKREEKKKLEKMQKEHDRAATGWNGYNKFLKKEQRRAYR